ncbi:MAG: hypothetical protein KGL92_08310, partial [Gammaproteobacteria bacterium]|nr:hypothetical protein [Gammaproteobacteria bacterium]
WSKNGTAISGATAATYTTPATVQADNSASFTVHIANSAGSTTSNAATLTVTTAAPTAPAITTQPQSQTVSVGSAATFMVSATGTAPLSYQWSRNGTAISGATAATYTTPATVQTDNGASFTVHIANSAGAVTSNAASLTVTTAAPTAPAITTQPQSQTVTVGATATFSVVATGTAPLSYQWSKSGTAINGATAASYTTPATVQADNGASFTVHITNSAGAVTSNAATLTVAAAGTGTDVTTYHDDVARTGQDLTESILTTANVRQATFGLKLLLPVDGKVDAQPLALSQYTIGGTSHNVVFAATEHDSVYAFDADTGAQLWKASMLGAGETPSDDRGCNQVTPEIGVVSTPVIDRAAGVMYVVAMSKDSGGNYIHRLHELSLATGGEMPGSPVIVAASVPDTGAPFAVNGQLMFVPAQYKERAALLLSQGTVYTSWTSHCDGPSYTGWVIAYGAASMQQTAVFNSNPSGVQGGGQGEASFWNSGSGPSADSSGNLYAMSANGVFDTTLTAGGFPVGNDYGNSILKLSPAPSGSVSVLDYFTMYNTNALSATDTDLGSGGLMLVPDQTDSNGATRHLAIGAGKDQNIYLIDRDHMGKYNTSTQDNSNAYQVLPQALGPFTAQNCNSPESAAGEYGAPVYFNGSVYYGGSGDVIRAFALTNARLPATPTMQTGHAFCYPGAAMSISANGTANGIVWAVENFSTQGVLYAYDAANLSSELYDSAQAGTRDQFGPGSKFTPPTIANGKVFVATQGGAGVQNYIAVFGLL